MKMITDRERVEAYIPVAKFIAAAFGPRCEVVLHYLNDIDHSIIYIENGYITGRKVGDRLTRYTLNSALSGQKDGKAYVTNLHGKTPINGRSLRFSEFYIKNDTKTIVGLLCVIIDVTDIEVMQRFSERELSPYHNLLGDEGAGQEEFSLFSTEMIETAFKRALTRMDCTDPTKMPKRDKLRLVAILDEQNLFSMKGAVAFTAEKLGISEPSVYRYLRESKNYSNNLLL